MVLDASKLSVHPVRCSPPFEVGCAAAGSTDAFVEARSTAAAEACPRLTNTGGHGLGDRTLHYWTGGTMAKPRKKRKPSMSKWAFLHPFKFLFMRRYVRDARRKGWI